MARGNIVQDGGAYKHNLARVEVESLVAPLRDKEPTSAWVKQFNECLRQFNECLRHFKMSQATLSKLASESGRKNMLGRPYTISTLNNMLMHYQSEHSWTKNAQKSINDHLDILVDYLSKPEEEPKTLLQRLEESGRKPVHPKTNRIDEDEPHPGESWADYGNRLAQRVDDAKRTIAESIVTLVSKKPVKVKLTRVHIIRR